MFVLHSVVIISYWPRFTNINQSEKLYFGFIQWNINSLYYRWPEVRFFFFIKFVAKKFLLHIHKDILHRISRSKDVRIKTHLKTSAKATTMIHPILLLFGCIFNDAKCSLYLYVTEYNICVWSTLDFIWTCIGIVKRWCN